MTSQAIVPAPTRGIESWRIVPCPSCAHHEARLVPPRMIDGAAVILCPACWFPFGNAETAAALVRSLAERAYRKAHDR
jgi:hypothetical protein